MTITIGCTGHQRISAATRRRVAAEIVCGLADVAEDIVGVCCLARGSDQVFAHAVLAAGGRLHAVIPSAGSAAGFDEGPTRDAFTQLLELAETRTFLSYAEPCEEAYMAAGEMVANLADVLIAVWDGKPAAGLGGTADVVAYARDLGREVTVIWPPNSSRG